MRTKAITLTILTMILLVFGSAFAWWTNYSQAVFGQIECTLATGLTSALGTRVDIGQLQAAGLTSAVVNNVTIFDKQGRELAAIDQVTVEYSLLSLVRGRTAIDAVRNITLTRPKILLVREANGTWNAECLRQKSNPDGPVFNGRVAVKQGTVQVSAPQGEWNFTGVDGLFGINGKQSVDFKLSGSENGSHINAQGFIDNPKSSLSLTVKAGQINPAAYERLLPAGTDVKFTGGVLEAVEVTLADTPAGLSYAGEFVVNGLAAQINGVPVEQARGRVTFTHNNVYILGGSALVAGQPVTVGGKIAIAGDKPVFSLTVGSPGFDPAVVANNLPFTGSVAFAAEVAGTIDSPLISAQLKTSEAAVAGYRIQDAAAKAGFAHGILTVNEFSARMLGGQVHGQGVYDIASQRYQLQLAGAGIDMAAVRGLPVEISGSGDVNIAAGGQGSDWRAATATADITLNAGKINGTPYTKLVGFIDHTGWQTELKYFNALLPSGVIAANGVLQGDRLNINIAGQGVELKDIPYATVKDISFSGTAGFDGTITGTVADPLLTLNFNVAGLKMNEQLLGQASGGLKASPRAVAFDRVMLTDSVAGHELTGTVLLDGPQPELNLRLTTHSARAETFARLLIPEVKLTGNIDHEVTVTGPLTNVAVQGKVKLTEGSLDGYLIAKAEGSYQRQNGVITVSNLDINSLNTKIKLSGTVAPDNRLDFAVTAEDIDLARVKANYPYPVSGKASLDGHITGTVKSPVLTGQLTAPVMLLNGQELKNIFASVSYHDSNVDIRELRFAQGAGSYVFGGTLDLPTSAIDGLLRVEGGELAGILAIANLPDRGIRGSLNGEIVLSGTTANPNVILRGAITGGRIKDYPLDTIDVDAELNNRVITINKFTAKQGTDGLLAAKGRADLDGQIDLEVGGRDIEAGIIAALFDTTVETKGVFSFNAQADGPAADPNVAVSLEVKNGSVANAEFDNLYGLLIFNHGSIHVNQLFVARGPYKASAYGIVPLKALNSQGRSQADITDKMDLKLRLDNADLSILPLLTKDVAWAAGPTAGEIAVGGTLANPTLNGRLRAVNGTVKLKALTDPIQNVGVDIEFAGDKININDVDGQMGGGSFALSGSARVNGLALTDYNITLTLKRLGVKHKYFSGPVDGVLSLTSPNDRPRISGKLTVENATVNIPAVPDSGKIDFNAGLDVELVIGDKVRMYNPYLYDFRAEGKVKFSGSLQRPAASGRVEAQRGTVKYLTNRFTIESGSAEFIQYRSIEPVIKLQASTKLEQTTINLNIDGPVTAMDLKLTSEPAMSQQEIMSLLTLRGGYFTNSGNLTQGGRDSVLGRDELVSLLDAGLQMRFIAEMESTLQNTLGVDEFRLVRSSLFDIYSKRTNDVQTGDNFQGYNLEIGKYLTDKLLLSYSMGLDQKNNSITLHYDLNKRIGIGGTFGGANNGLYTLETRFRF